jgi:hypothetical protein
MVSRQSRDMNDQTCPAGKYTMAGVTLDATIGYYIRRESVTLCTDVEESQDPPPHRPPEDMAELGYV